MSTAWLPSQCRSFRRPTPRQTSHGSFSDCPVISSESATMLLRRTMTNMRPHRPSRRGCLLLFIALVASAAFPGSAKAWWNDDWSLRKKIIIDTSASGTAITDLTGPAPPVLLRLHAGNFRFVSAKENGSDLRFISADDKTPLKFQIEKYNSLPNEALIWVSVPELKAGARTEFWLYYNNRKAAGVSDAKGVFDSDTLLDYHFAENATPPQDSSIWANHATNAARTAEGSLIGQGLRLDGSATLTVPDAPSLSMPEGAAATWSAWVNMTAPLPGAILFSRREEGNA